MPTELAFHMRPACPLKVAFQTLHALALQGQLEQRRQPAHVCIGRSYCQSVDCQSDSSSTSRCQVTGHCVLASCTCPVWALSAPLGLSVWQGDPDHCLRGLHCQVCAVSPIKSLPYRWGSDMQLHKHEPILQTFESSRCLSCGNSSAQGLCGKP